MERCMRCGRTLKNPVVIECGVFGPICVRKFAVENAMDDESEVGAFAPLESAADRYILSRSLKGALNAYKVWMVNGEERRALLNPRLDIWNKSPSGFEVGYGGSGPAQLALAILCDVTKLRAWDEWTPFPFDYQEFKWNVLSSLQLLPGESYEVIPESLRPYLRTNGNDLAEMH